MSEISKIEETVRAFKEYMTIAVKHNAIDYARKIKSAKYKFIYYNDVYGEIVSLSSNDKGTFFELNENIFEDEQNNITFGKLTKKQRQIIILTAEGYSDKEIALELKTTTNDIKTTRNVVRNKFKKNRK